jgi:N6-L-threonylcarbamoyladenine synthase
VAASFQQAVMDVIVDKSVGAVLERYAKNPAGKKLVLAGGVASNTKLRAMLEDACAKKGIELFRPSPILCTDNAAMIGCSAYYKYKEFGADSMDMDAYPSLPLPDVE